MTTQGIITTLVVDDEIDMRILVKTVLELAHIDVDVVAEATNGAEALEMYLGLNPPTVPTVVILDNRMPHLTGLEAARQILAIHPEQLVILYSAQLDDHTVVEATELGVRACLSKEQLDEIPRVIAGLVNADV